MVKLGQLQQSIQGWEGKVGCPRPHLGPDLGPAFPVPYRGHRVSTGHGLDLGSDLVLGLGLDLGFDNKIQFSNDYSIS